MNINSNRVGLLASMIIVLLSGSAVAEEVNKIDPVANQVKQIVEQEKLVLTPQCVDYFLTKNFKPGVDLVDVLEKHNAECGGDPKTHPRLFSVYVDQKTHRMASDVDDISGTGSLKELHSPTSK